MQEINGDSELVALERAIHELRCGRAVYCCERDAPGATESGLLVAAAETVSAPLLARLEKRSAPASWTLAITADRADALGLATDAIDGKQAALLVRSHRLELAAMVQALAGVQPAGSVRLPLEGGVTIEAGDALTTAILSLVKRARLLPAVLMIRSAPVTGALTVTRTQLERLAPSAKVELERISEARVPVARHEDCRLVLFRDNRDASEHVAVLIGSPQPGPVTVRLHSACLTGDLLASLRCDCGDQLRTAVDQLAAVGGGVLLYLAQEGRGIGLANKLRAYELQDTGLDTIDADAHLGFGPDERDYIAAASMLRQLGMTRIRLLTNNVQKMQALRDAGIEVVGAERLIGAVNRHNARYVHAKRARAGPLMPAINLDEIL